MEQKLFWREYLKKDSFGGKRTKIEIIYLNKIKKFLDKNPKYQGIDGHSYPYKKIKKFSKHTFTARAWGHLMASYMNSRAKRRKYDYLSFYM